MLQIIFFAIVVGIAIAYLKESKIERIAKARYGPGVLGPLAIVVIALYVGLFIHIVVVYGGILSAFKLNLIKFLKGVKEAMLTAFVTRSSLGTLPVTMSVAESNLRISRSIYAFTLPLRATINMDGTAMYQAICNNIRSKRIRIFINNPTTIDHSTNGCPSLYRNSWCTGSRTHNVGNGP